jgi:hypothetical protein
MYMPKPCRGQREERKKKCHYFFIGLWKFLPGLYLSLLPVKIIQEKSELPGYLAGIFGLQG